MFRFINLKYLFVLCFAAFAFLCKAQNKRLTLPDALKAAEENYPSIKAALLKKSSAEYNVSARKSEYLPALNLQDQVTYATANGAIGSFFPNEGMALPTSGAIRPENIYSATFGSYSTIAVNWSAYNFGKIKAKVDLAKAQLNEADVEYQNELFRHKVKVVDAYLLLLAYQKSVVVEQKNLDRAQSVKTTIAAAAKSGLKAGADSSFANAELSKAKILLLQVQGKRDSQKILLRELLGSGDATIEIDSMNYVTSIPSFVTKDSADISNNTELKIFQSRVLSGEAKSKQIMKSYLPSLKVIGAGVGRGSGISNTNDKYYSPNFSDGVSYKAYNYLFGVYFLWNVLDYPRLHNEYKSELLLSQESKLLFEEKKLKVKGDMENAELQLSIARSQAAEAPVELKSATDAYQQSKARYQSGLTNLVDFNQNIYLLNRAESDQVIAYNNVWRALLLKAAAAGDMNIFLNAK